MKAILGKIIGYTIMKLDGFYLKLYPKTKDITYEILSDYSRISKELDFGEFISTHGKQAVRELYTILNVNYNSKLSELIGEGNAEEISKLKYLHLILLDIKSILNNNY